MKSLIQIIVTILMLVFVVGCTNSGGVKEDKSHEDKAYKSVEDDHSNKEEVKIDFPVDGYTFFGFSEVIPDKAVSVEEMVSIIQKEGAFEGHVNAVLDGVCKKMGCWVTMVNKSGKSIRVRFKDHEFGVPTETPVGTLVVLRGVGKVDTVSIDMQKHYLDDAKEAGEEVSQEEYDKITEDLIDYSFISDGILVSK